MVEENDSKKKIAQLIDGGEVDLSTLNHNDFLMIAEYGDNISYPIEFIYVILNGPPVLLDNCVLMNGKCAFKINEDSGTTRCSEWTHEICLYDHRSYKIAVIGKETKESTISKLLYVAINLKGDNDRKGKLIGQLKNFASILMRSLGIDPNVLSDQR